MSVSPESILPDPDEAAALYAVGALSQAETEAFELRLRDRSPAWCEAWARVCGVAGALSDVEEITPSEGVRSSLRGRMGRRLSAPSFAETSGQNPLADAADAMVLLRAGEMDWQPSGVDGVSIQRLFVDPDSRRMTLLIRMDAGASYPDHDHPSVEECLVLDGDLEIAGTVLGRLDYLRTPRGGAHGEPRTRSGCVLLVTCAAA